MDRERRIMPLGEIIKERGYAIIPHPVRHFIHPQLGETDEPIDFQLPEGCKYAYIGEMQPPIRDPFDPKDEINIGRFLVFDPSRIDYAGPWFDPEENLDEVEAQFVSEGYAIVGTYESSGRINITAIRREPISAVAPSIY